MEIILLLLSIIIAGGLVWIITAKYYRKQLEVLKEENLNLKAQTSINQNLINELKLSFSQIAKDAISSEQEILLSQHSTDLKTKMDLFKAEEITPINNLLKEFKKSIENYQKVHSENTLEVKNAVATAEKYAKALTTDQNTKGFFGEDMLEQVLKYANLEENIHYSKQLGTSNGKPDFVIHLINNSHVIIDSKVILKKYLDYRQTDNQTSKQEFISDLTTCINSLANRNYENIENLNQPGFILMYIPIEACINLIYSDSDFRKIIELASSKNIIIVGTASLIVVLKLITHLWAVQVQQENVNNIIECGEQLYNNIIQHANNLMTIKKSIDEASQTVQTEINRLTKRNNGSILKEAEKLTQYGIKSQKNKTIPTELLSQQ